MFPVVVEVLGRETHLTGNRWVWAYFMTIAHVLTGSFTPVISWFSHCSYAPWATEFPTTCACTGRFTWFLQHPLISYMVAQ